MNRYEEILSILKTFIVPKCELIYSNNYELICAVMLSAQTTDKAVNLVSKDLFMAYSDFDSLSKAAPSDIVPYISRLGLSKAKSNNLVSMAKIIMSEYGGVLPNTMDELTRLPGIGRKTASVVLALGFNIPAFPVDTHVSRVAVRLKMAYKDDSILKIEERLRRNIPKSDWIDAHHLLLLFGRYHCLSQNPKCEGCKLKKYCRNA